MVTLLAALALQQGIPMQMVDLMGPDKKTRTSLMIVRGARLDEPKHSPKAFGEPPQHWMFEWIVGGYGLIGNQQDLRFDVYSQEHKSVNDRAPMVTRMLQRLWEHNYRDFGIDHSQEFGRRVSVYLCLGGKAGGEQLFDEDPETNGHGVRKANTIYFYDLRSFTDPIEMAREVAHEYGHATLPAIGGFREPEDWANGYLGERVYLSYLARSMRAGALTSDDAMGTTLPALDGWLKKNVDPLVAKVVENGPDLEKLKGTDKAAMDAYLGLAMYTATILPDSVFSRSMQIVGSTSAKDYPDAIVTAAEEPESYTLRVPAALAGRAMWIPNVGTVAGAKVFQRRGDWSRIAPTGGPITITPKHEG